MLRGGAASFQGSGEAKQREEMVRMSATNVKDFEIIVE